MNELVWCCEYTAPCCFKRKDGRCKILNDTDFDDEKCHFRKTEPFGENLYDKERRERKNKNPG